jgi:hypothetical protein
MEGKMNVGMAVLGLVEAGVIGGWLLRRAWRQQGNQRLYRTAGWGIMAGGLFFAALKVGPALGTALALMSEPAGALAVVALGAKRRAARAVKPGQLAPEPLQGPSRVWRGGLKFLLAGPLGMLAAMGLAFCYASWAPGAVQTRLLIAALLMPALWGVAMTWTLADQRMIRATAVLVAATIFGFGLAFLGGIA